MWQKKCNVTLKTMSWRQCIFCLAFFLSRHSSLESCYNGKWRPRIHGKVTNVPDISCSLRLKWQPGSANTPVCGQPSDNSSAQTLSPTKTPDVAEQRNELPIVSCAYSDQHNLRHNEWLVYTTKFWRNVLYSCNTSISVPLNLILSGQSRDTRNGIEWNYKMV